MIWLRFQSFKPDYHRVTNNFTADFHAEEHGGRHPAYFAKYTGVVRRIYYYAPRIPARAY
jgi:hypothetical protein